MQQPAAAPVVELVRWQTATLVASAVAAVELVVLLVLGFALLTGEATDGVRKPQAAAAAPAAKRQPSPPPAAKPKPAVAKLSRGETSVLILNGNGVSGAAAAAAARVEGAGYRVGTVGNAARTDYGESLIMYRKGRQGEAERFARDLRVKLVAPLDGMRARDLGGAHVVLVVGGR